MIRLAPACAVLALVLSACGEPVALDPARDTPPPSPQLLREVGLMEAPRTPWEALEPFYDQFVYDIPRAPSGPPLPGAEDVLTSIAFGSCNTPERAIPILDVIAQGGHDLFIYGGDNVYGDARAYDATLPELRAAYHQLAARPEFRRLRAAQPMLAVWDDHDYGMNDLGRDFAFKGFSERLFLDFWGAERDDVRRSREGIYDAHVFGPEGRRVQVILLDTRWFRSDLTPTDERGAPGRERYVPSEDPDQDMLGEAQWAWLEAQLREPAELRLLVSSIQVHADGHGWESWRTLPRERDRLYRLIRETGANGVVIASGDRHAAGLYVRADLTSYPLYEITSSSLNMPFRDEHDEPGPHRIGDMYAPENYGVIAIDWEGGSLNLEIRDVQGAVVREQGVPLSRIGAAP
ncbi:alkaline phosphatase family protein [Alkalicaulis satelles]|uniref:Alkaline phosphatase family protein n=1 Tax=Alkalicaulis satelles TaxID=2609175 RepID=A0A5M6ZDL0_9PROT|nr:alkaline phosphatase D family protein [Alkalicaulis satelles]KAA5802300.1 alkaline phosphatase family protein [Alkalicaulis satelles]